MILFTYFTYQTVGFMNESKEHILLTSLQLFLQKNFKEVTMKEIVDKTGLSKGAFYYYFNSKEQVFAEAIKHFFLGIMNTDFTQMPQTSLKAFYTAVLKKIEQSRIKIEQLVPKQAADVPNNNFFYLIFDAMRLLPDFKANHLRSQQEELKAWKTIISAAKKNKEIETPMTNEQAAKLFIYLSDGININIIMADNLNKLKNELKSLWDGLYDSLKMQA